MIIFTSTVTNLYHLYFQVFFKKRTLQTGGRGVLRFVTRANIGGRGGLEIGGNCERNLWMAPYIHLIHLAPETQDR